MAHKVIDGKAVVDWTTGDPEGDRLHVLAAYRDFIKEVYELAEQNELTTQIFISFKRWQIDTENQIDEVPRIRISRPQ